MKNECCAENWLNFLYVRMKRCGSGLGSNSMLQQRLKAQTSLFLSENTSIWPERKAVSDGFTRWYYMCSRIDLMIDAEEWEFTVWSRVLFVILNFKESQVFENWWGQPPKINNFSCETQTFRFSTPSFISSNEWMTGLKQAYSESQEDLKTAIGWSHMRHRRNIKITVY